MCYDTRCKKEAVGMTIKKRLFCSNILMIVVPAVIVAFIGLLCMALLWISFQGGYVPAAMEELNLREEDYGFYLDLRKYGSTRHSGFGLGFERCVMYLTGMQNIRDVIPFPRTVNNCEL